MILAIDPGPEQSAYVLWDGKSIHEFGKQSNDEVLQYVRSSRDLRSLSRCVIEQIKSYGMAVGEEVFETCVWSGRFMEAFGAERIKRVPRLDVKLHLCHSSKANDAAIRQAIIDRFGGKEKAIGRKASPGPLYGVSGDVWAALGVALTFWDKQRFDARLKGGAND